MPSTLGPYELRGELGRGAMAVVWRGFDPNLEREVAIKEPLLADGLDAQTVEQMAQRFVREGKAAAKLNHPGIVTIYAADVFAGRPAIVMELIEGETLASVLRAGPLEAASAVAILDQLLEAAAYAHERGIVHRDIKPDNVFVTHDGRVKLADFGIAHLGTSSTLTQAGTVMGTPGYMAPEQVQGLPVDARADIFAIGALAYEMLAGRNPFGAEDIATHPTAVMYRIVHEEPEPVPDVALAGLPLDIRPVIAAAMAKNPLERFQDAAGFRAALHGGPVPGSQAAVAPVGMADQPSGSPVSRGTLITAGVAAVGVVAVVGLLLATTGNIGARGSAGGETTATNGPPTETNALTLELKVPKEAAVGEPVTVEAVASDPSQVKIVKFFSAGKVLGEDSSAPYTYAFTADSPGEYRIQAKATSISGTVKGSPTMAVSASEVDAGPTLVRNGDPEAEIRSVIDRWVWAFTVLDLDAHMDCYGPVIDPYFGTPDAKHAKVKRDKRGAFNDEYTRTDMSVSNVDIDVQDESHAVATLDKAWDFRSDIRFAGEELQRLRFEKIGGEWKIVGEEELDIYWYVKE